MKETPWPTLRTSQAVNWERLRIGFGWAFDGEPAAELLDCRYDGTMTAGWFIRQGRATLRFGKNTFYVKAGQWVFPPMIDGWQELDPGTQILSIRFLARWPDRKLLYSNDKCLIVEANEAHRLEQTGGHLAKFIRRSFGQVHYDFLSKPSGLTLHLQIQERLQRWVGAYAETMQASGLVPYVMEDRDERCASAMEFIDDHPLGRKFIERDVAKFVGISLSQINRVFQREYGTTLKRHFDLRRRDAAKSTLTFTDQPVKSIAYQLGFGSLPHFTRWFKKMTGRSPTSWRTSFSSTKQTLSH